MSGMQLASAWLKTGFRNSLIMRCCGSADPATTEPDGAPVKHRPTCTHSHQCFPQAVDLMLQCACCPQKRRPPLVGAAQGAERQQRRSTVCAQMSVILTCWAQPAAEARRREPERCAGYRTRCSSCGFSPVRVLLRPPWRSVRSCCCRTGRLALRGCRSRGAVGGWCCVCR